MKDVIEFLEKYSLEEVIVFSLFLIVAIYGVITAIKKFKATLDDYYFKRKEIQNREDSIDARFVKIETIQEEHTKQLKDIKSEFSDLKKSIENLKESQEKNMMDQKRIARAQAKSTMTRLADEIIRQGYASTQQNDVLTEIESVYLQCGTIEDGYVVPARVSKALHMDILSDEEIERLHREREKHHGKRKTDFGKAFKRVRR